MFAYLDAGTGRSVAKVHDGEADLGLGEASLPLYADQQASIDTTGPLSQDLLQEAPPGRRRGLR